MSYGRCGGKCKSNYIHNDTQVSYHECGAFISRRSHITTHQCHITAKPYHGKALSRQSQTNFNHNDTVVSYHDTPVSFHECRAFISRHTSVISRRGHITLFLNTLWFLLKNPIQKNVHFFESKNIFSTHPRILSALTSYVCIYVPRLSACMRFVYQKLIFSINGGKS